MRKKWSVLLCLFALFFTLAGCGQGDGRRLVIAEQFGIAYAPLQIMKEQGLLEAALPDYRIEWVQMGGPTAIREGMLAGDIHVGFMGIGPMLMGVDTGMNWRCFGALSANEVSFITNRPDVRSLKDLGPADRVAILSPGSTQHILLCLAAERELGDLNAFDARIVSLSHPDGMSAMLAGGEIALHITTPPYADLELESGMRKILTGQEVMGVPFTFICGVADEDFYRERREAYDALLKCFRDVTDAMNADLPAAAHALFPVYGVDEEMLLSAMGYNGTIYQTALSGVDQFAAAMVRLGFLSKAPARADYLFPEAEVLD